MRCRTCNCDISTATGYCPMCGEDLSKGGYDNTPVPQQTPKTSGQMPKFTGSSAPQSGNYTSNNPYNTTYGTSHNTPRNTVQNTTYGTSHNTPRHIYSGTDTQGPSMTDPSSYYTNTSRSYHSVPPTSVSAPVSTPAYNKPTLPKANTTPLSPIALLLTALLASALLLYELASVGSGSGLFMQLFSSIEPFDDIARIIGTGSMAATLLFKLPTIATVLAMWFIFAAIASPHLKSGLFSAGITLLKVFRIFTLVIWCIVLGLFALVFFTISRIPASARGPFLLGYVVVLAVLIMVVVYHSAIVRMLNTLRDGTERGIYYKASGYVIFCLFASCFLTLLPAVVNFSFLSYFGIYGLTSLSFVSVASNIILPMLHGICLCVYNTNRHKFNSLS